MTTTSINMDKIPPFVKIVTKGQNTIHTLEPGFLSNFDLSTRIFRSLITDQTGAIVSIAPAKSLPNEDFLGIFTNFTRMRATEIIEGTMINLFWNGSQWEIATKRSVGCDYHFFRNEYFPGLEEPEQKSFRQMMLDAVSATYVGGFANSLNLAKNRCYSFVVQHPSNHIVVPVDAAALYLVGCYEINELTYKFIDVFDLKEQFAGSQVKFPRCFVDTSEQVAIEQCFECGHAPTDNIPVTIANVVRVTRNSTNSYRIPGIMITELDTGFRTSFANVKYEEVKLLRGNNPNLHYQYLVLRKVNRDAEFLRYFPQYSAHFARFREHFDAFATRIHRLYIDIHVTKVIALDAVVDKRDKYHIEKLHYNFYIPALKLFKSGDSNDATKPKVTRATVVEYLDGENIMVPL
jgi:hypothetical protein